MPGLDWSALEAARLKTEPFDHFTVAQVLEPGCAAAIGEAFPQIRAAGSFSLTDARPGPALTALIDDVQSERFKRQMERLFGLTLDDAPCLVTLRGYCSGRDGAIHTDSRSKILSLLLYLNDDWATDQAQLRLLRGERDIEDYAVQVPATFGSLVGFRRSDGSWHGHTAFEGRRRVLQLNYLRSARAAWLGAVRHRISALTKSPVA